MYKLVTELHQIGPFLSDLSKSNIVSIDTETTGLDCHQDKLTTIQIKLNQTTYIFDVRKLGVKHTTYIIDLLKSSEKLCIGHNLKFDFKFIRKFTGILLFNGYDTMLGEIILHCGVNDRFYSYKDLVEKYCGIELSKEERNDFIGNPDVVLTEQLLIYSALDVEYLEAIYNSQLELLKEQKLTRVALEIEMPCVSATAEMEYNGISMDIELWKKLEAQTQIKAEETSKVVLEKLLNDITEKLEYKNALDLCEQLNITDGIDRKYKRTTAEQIVHPEYVKKYIQEHLNLNSSNQMLAVLTKVYKVPVKNTNEKVINKYLDKYPIITDLLEYRGFAKGVASFGETYINAINPVTLRVHTDYNQIVSTGRYSSLKPNMQNVKRESEYRDGFIAEPGWSLVCADYSQQELRVLAQLSRDKKLIEMFQLGIDPHIFTASKLFKIPFEEVTKDQRYKGKTMNFAVVYGISAWGLKRTLSIPIEEAEKYLDTFFNEVYTGVRDFFKEASKQIWAKKYSVTLSGRKRYFENRIGFKDYKEFEKYQASMYREGDNAIIQGTSADITKTALNLLLRNNPFGSDFRLLLQVHDEVVCEAKEEIKNEAKEFVTKCMLDAEGQFVDRVPCAVDCKVAERWVH